VSVGSIYSASADVDLFAPVPASRTLTKTPGNLTPYEGDRLMLRYWGLLKTR